MMFVCVRVCVCACVCVCKRKSEQERRIKGEYRVTVERFLSALGIWLATEPSSSTARNVQKTTFMQNGVRPFVDKKNLTLSGNKY